jgi:23S rRNA (cytosine1962-C5)-methyltransferase
MSFIQNELISSALKKRTHLHGSGDTNAYRIFNGIGDGLDGFIIDRYDEYLLVQVYNPEIIDNVENWIFEINDFLGILPFPIKGIFLKNRTEKAVSQTDNVSRLIYGSDIDDNYTVRQSGVIVLVDLINGINSGLFLDMKEVRDYLKKLYPETLSLLNLFSYTSVFAVHALLNGVKKVTNVDISKTVLKRARLNYELNNLKIDDRDFIPEDSEKFLKKCIREKKSYSMTIFDPPTFARNKSKSFSVKKDYSRLLTLMESITEQYVVSVVNSFSVNDEEYLSYHPKSWNLVHLMHESSDFTFSQQQYLKVGIWKV